MKKDFNFQALMGLDIKDEDFVQTLGMPAEIANTPGVNDWVLDNIEQDHIVYHQEQGMSESEAKSKAAEQKRSAHKNINEMLASRGLL